MTLYEKRTYTVPVGRMGEVVDLYREMAWPAMEAGGFSANLVGYFISDTGPLHQLIHIWRFEDDAARHTGEAVAEQVDHGDPHARQGTP